MLSLSSVNVFMHLHDSLHLTAPAYRPYICRAVHIVNKFERVGPGDGVPVQAEYIRTLFGGGRLGPVHLGDGGAGLGPCMMGHPSVNRQSDRQI